MARALELVRSRDTTGVISIFLSWVNRVPMQDMLYYTVNLTSKNLPNQWGNCEYTILLGLTCACKCCLSSMNARHASLDSAARAHDEQGLAEAVEQVRGYSMVRKSTM
jgi:hypothetical protein